MRINVCFPDKFTFAAFLLTGIALLLPTPAQPLRLFPLILGAVFEEILFRWGLQHYLSAIPLLTKRVLAKSVSGANITASFLFALLHLINHPPLWALATFLPSLLLGELWDRHQRLSLCIALHLCYNLGYYYL